MAAVSSFGWTGGYLNPIASNTGAVQIDENDISLIGAYYNVSNGEFERREPEPEPEPEPTEQEVVNAELLLGQALMLESQLALERTAALILLETVRGEA